MDPFTQRMIERAKERRAKYAGKLQDNLGESQTKRSPLQESNKTIVEVTTKVTVKSPLKSPIKEMSSPAPKYNKNASEYDIKSPKQKIIKEDIANAATSDLKIKLTDDSQSPPKLNSCLRDTSKSRLKRLGALYSDTQLSSPIHRTESQFCADSTSDSDSENINTQMPSTSSKTPRPSAVGRTRRLAQLANQINEWEDEPRVKASRNATEFKEEPKKRQAPQPPSTIASPSKRQAPQPPPMPKSTIASARKQSPAKILNELKKESPKKEIPNKGIIPAAQGVATKKQIWDKRILESLESQGFQRTVSNSKLIFDYNKSESSQPPKILEIRAKMKPETNIPEKKVQLKPTAPPPSGSVMQRAAIFESSSPKKKNTRDPSELPISERLALFEKGSKGNPPAPLIPKAAFAMNIPTTKQQPSTSNINIERAPNKIVSIPKPKPSAPPMSEDEIPAQDPWFRSQIKSNTECIVESQRQERQRELQALKDRWNGQRHLMGCSPERVVEQPPPPPPPPVQSTNKMEKQNFTKILEKNEEPIVESKRRSSSSIKRIRVSPPKPGMLYPNLSDIEATTTDTDQEPKESHADNSYEPSNEESSFEDSSQDLGDSSFGREILNVATNGTEMMNVPTCEDSSDDSRTENMLRDFDGYLDNAIDQVESDNDSEPTPPKRGRTSISKTSLTAHSNSFEFKYKHEDLPEVVEDSSGNVIPLMHTVSFYRRQQQQHTNNSNVRQIIRTPTSTSNEPKEETEIIDPELVKARISKLLDEISKLQTIISQTSQALNYCESTIEFSGSKEQLEAERVLLLLTHQRQAMLNEVQRLRIEGSTGPLGGEGNGQLQLSSISVTLNRDFLRQMANDDLCQYLVCLARCGDQVQATSALEASVSTLGKDARLQFPGPPLRLSGLPTDFIVALEVYCYKFRKEILPEEIKYHINQKECHKSRLTPKKHKSNANSRLTKPPMHMTAGGSSSNVRVPCFQLAGHVMFSLRETHRTHFTLTKVAAPYASPLEGSLQIQMSCTLALNVTHASFLTVFQEVGGFGAWHRRWARLDGDKLHFWKYPDDEKIKGPMQSISLSDPSSTPIGPVSRDKCARPNTFLVETTAISQLLSADTREEREEWCRQLNKALGLVRAWGGASQTHS